MTTASSPEITEDGYRIDRLRAFGRMVNTVLTQHGERPLADDPLDIAAAFEECRGANQQPGTPFSQLMMARLAVAEAHLRGGGLRELRFAAEECGHPEVEISWVPGEGDKDRTGIVRAAARYIAGIYSQRHEADIIVHGRVEELGMTGDFEGEVIDLRPQRLSSFEVSPAQNKEIIERLQQLNNASGMTPRQVIGCALLLDAVRPPAKDSEHQRIFAEARAGIISALRARLFNSQVGSVHTDLVRQLVGYGEDQPVESLKDIIRGYLRHYQVPGETIEQSIVRARGAVLAGIVELYPPPPQQLPTKKGR